MSLESQVAALVEATNKLTNTVSNKISDINNTVANKLKEVDAAVSKVAADIRATIKGEFSRRIYVDQVNGNDAWSGSQQAPLKSFTQAVLSAPSGASLEVRFIGDYDFSLHSSDVVVSVGSLQITSADGLNPSTLLFSIGESDQESYFVNSIAAYSPLSIEFYRINVKLPDVPWTHGVGKKYQRLASVIKTTASPTAPYLDVSINAVEIFVPQPEINGVNFVGTVAKSVSLATASVVMPVEWRDRNKLVYGSRASTTAFHHLTCSGRTLVNSDDGVINDGVVS